MKKKNKHKKRIYTSYGTVIMKGNSRSGKRNEQEPAVYLDLNFIHPQNLQTICLENIQTARNLFDVTSKRKANSAN